MCVWMVLTWSQRSVLEAFVYVEADSRSFRGKVLVKTNKKLLDIEMVQLAPILTKWWVLHAMWVSWNNTPWKIWCKFRRWWNVSSLHVFTSAPLIDKYSLVCVWETCEEGEMGCHHLQGKQMVDVRHPNVSNSMQKRKRVRNNSKGS